MEGAIAVIVLFACFGYGFAIGQSSTEREVARDCQAFEAFVIDGIEYKCAKEEGVAQ